MQRRGQREQRGRQTWLQEGRRGESEADRKLLSSRGPSARAGVVNCEHNVRDVRTSCNAADAVPRFLSHRALDVKRQSRNAFPIDCGTHESLYWQMSIRSLRCRIPRDAVEPLAWLVRETPLCRAGEERRVRSGRRLENGRAAAPDACASRPIRGVLPLRPLWPALPQPSARQCSRGRTVFAWPLPPTLHRASPPVSAAAEVRRQHHWAQGRLCGALCRAPCSRASKREEGNRSRRPPGSHDR